MLKIPYATIEKALAILKASGLGDADLSVVRRRLDGGMSMDGLALDASTRAQIADLAFAAQERRAKNYSVRFPESDRIKVCPY